MNVQVACTIYGKLAWISDPVDGSRHDNYCQEESGRVHSRGSEIWRDLVSADGGEAMDGRGVQVASDEAPAGEGSEGVPVAGDGLVALGCFRSALGDVGRPVRGEDAGEHEDLLL